jgi:hypothetical protein
MPPIKFGETITTTEPKLEIAPSRDAPLPLGTHTFQLVVEDDKGLQSAPATVQVVVQKTTPDAVIKGPGKVEVNKSFTLDGAGSAAVSPSKLAKFQWTLLPNVKP